MKNDYTSEFLLTRLSPRAGFTPSKFFTRSDQAFYPVNGHSIWRYDLDVAQVLARAFEQPIRVGNVRAVHQVEIAAGAHRRDAADVLAVFVDRDAPAAGVDLLFRLRQDFINDFAQARGDGLRHRRVSRDQISEGGGFRRGLLYRFPGRF